MIANSVGKLLRKMLYGVVGLLPLALIGLGVAAVHVAAPTTGMTTVPVGYAPNALQINKASNADLITAGEMMTYTIVATNTGPGLAQGIVLYDPLPVGVHYSGTVQLFTQGTSPVLQGDQRQLTATIASLVPNGIISITAPVYVLPNVAGLALTNTVILTASIDSSPVNVHATLRTALITATPTPSPTPTATQTPSPTPSPTATVDANASTATATATQTPVAMATATATATPTATRNAVDLQVRKESYPAVIAGGAPLTYTVYITNIGPAAAQNVLIQDQLPTGLTFAGRTVMSTHLAATPNLLLSRDGLTATVGTLFAGGLITITAPTVLLVEPATLLLTNTVHITSTTPELTPVDNMAKATTTVRSATMPYSIYLPRVETGETGDGRRE